MNEIEYLNGKFIAADDAKISANDRGFIFADGVYEVAKYYNGKAFRYADHLERLERSLNEIGIKYPETDQLEGVFNALIEQNGLQNQHAGIYLQITRGTAKRVHHFPGDIAPTVYAYAFELPSNKENQEKGIRLIMREDIRWKRCDIKSVSLLPNTMLYNQAVDEGAGECALVRDGFVTEATHSSLFAVKNGIVVTRPLSNLILPGITRKVVLEICQAENIKLEERLFSPEELLDMDEVFICGTGSEITPVTQIEETQIGDGNPGAITCRIQKAFFDLVPV